MSDRVTFEDLDMTITAMSTMTGSFGVTKPSAEQALLMTKFLKALDRKPPRVLPESNEVVLTAEDGTTKYFLTCKAETFELDSIVKSKISTP